MTGVARRRTGRVTRIPAGTVERIDPSDAQYDVLAPVITRFIAYYAANPQWGSTVVPWWLPTGQLSKVLADRGIPEGLTEGVLRRMERAGSITRRFMQIDGVVHPVARNNGDVRTPDAYDLNALITLLTPARLGLPNPKPALEGPQ